MSWVCKNAYSDLKLPYSIISSSDSNDSLVSLLLLTWSTSHLSQSCRLNPSVVKIQPAFVPQNVDLAPEAPWSSLSTIDHTLDHRLIDGFAGGAVCFVKHSVTPQNSFVAIRSFPKGKVVTFVDPSMPAKLDTKNPIRGLVFVTDRKLCSFCSLSNASPTPSMLFVGKGCAQLMLCSPGPGVNAELLSGGVFTVTTNGSRVAHTLVVARTTTYVASGEMFVMNCAYQSEDPASKMTEIELSMDLNPSQVENISIKSSSNNSESSPFSAPSTTTRPRSRTLVRIAVNPDASRSPLKKPKKATREITAGTSINLQATPSTAKLKSVAPRTADGINWVRSDFANDFLTMKYITSMAPSRPFEWPQDVTVVHKPGSPFDIRTRTMLLFEYAFAVNASPSVGELIELFKSNNSVTWSYTNESSTLTNTVNENWSAMEPSTVMTTRARTNHGSHFQALMPQIQAEDIDLEIYSAEVLFYHSDQKLLRETLGRRHCIGICRGEVRVAWTTKSSWARLDARYSRDFELVDVDQGRDIHFIRKLTPGYILYAEPGTFLQFKVSKDSVILLLTSRDAHVDRNLGDPNNNIIKAKKRQQTTQQRNQSKSGKRQKFSRKMIPVFDDDDDDDDDEDVRFSQPVNEAPTNPTSAVSSSLASSTDPATTTTHYSPESADAVTDVTLMSSSAQLEGDMIQSTGKHISRYFCLR